MTKKPDFKGSASTFINANIITSQVDEVAEETSTKSEKDKTNKKVMTEKPATPKTRNTKPQAEVKTEDSNATKKQNAGSGEREIIRRKAEEDLKSKRVVIPMTPEFHAQVKAKADEMHLPFTAFVTLTLAEALKK